MKLNSHNLVMFAMFGGRRGPRPPVGNPTSIACHGLMERAGLFFPEAHLNPNAMAELALAGHEIVGFDTVMPEYSVVQEAAALGARIDWGVRDKMPDVREFPNADFSDVVMPPDFLEKPSCRVLLDALSAGYLNVICVSPDDEPTVLFPNKFHNDGKVSAGPLPIPSGKMNFEMVARAPEGPWLILAFLSQTPLNLYKEGFHEVESLFAELSPKVMATVKKFLVRAKEKKDLASGKVVVKVVGDKIGCK